MKISDLQHGKQYILADPDDDTEDEFGEPYPRITHAYWIGELQTVMPPGFYRANAPTPQYLGPRFFIVPKERIKTGEFLIRPDYFEDLEEG